MELNIVQKKIAAHLIEFAEKEYFTTTFYKYDLLNRYKNSWHGEQVTKKFVKHVNSILRKKMHLNPGIDVYKF